MVVEMKLDITEIWYSPKGNFKLIYCGETGKLKAVVLL